MSELKKRIRDKSLHPKISPLKDTIRFFKNGMTLGFSGFSGGHPKSVLGTLADYVEQNNLQWNLRFNVFTGASIGRETDNRWAILGMTDIRCPYQNGDVIRKEINAGKVRMIDKHLSHFAQEISEGTSPAERGGKIDIALVEATGITEDGGVILSTAVGISPEIIRNADKVIIEVNTVLRSCEGLHDIASPGTLPHRRPLLIQSVADRIGSTTVACDPDKIVAIVESQQNDPGRHLGPVDEGSALIATHILDFLQSEVKHGRLPKNLLPIQSGVGNIANAVASGLVNGPFYNLQMWSEILQDTVLDLFDSGKLEFASATCFALSAKGIQRLYDNWDRYVSRTVLRPVHISNHPEVIRRLGLIGMNTPIEFDIYAHANSSLVGGSRMVNGIGGSGDFIRNAHLSIMHTPSTRSTRTDPTGITCVVPLATHVDHTEHDLDVLVTEQGIADLRGLCPKDRAQVIIDNCVHPDFKPIIQEYFDRAKRECMASRSAHEPHMLHKAFKMQQTLVEKGTMKIENWD